MNTFLHISIRYFIHLLYCGPSLVPQGYDYVKVLTSFGTSMLNIFFQNDEDFQCSLIPLIFKIKFKPPLRLTSVYGLNDCESNVCLKDY